MSNRGSKHLSSPDGTAATGLRALTPKFDSSQHQVYADALDAALKDPSVKNIALSGPYGVGKSSILQHLENGQKHRGKTIFISFSTLGKSSSDEASEAPTQHIQKEIVKQLIYAATPAQLPDSRFRRIGPTRRPAVFFIALALSIPLTEWTGAITPEWVKGPVVSILSYTPFTLSPKYLFTLFLTGGLYLVLQWLKSRIQVKDISAGPARLSITSDDSELSYFDKYLDEIVYFFSQTGKTIVIFEDIDRFDDTSIFEELHALNTLLNNAEQLKKRVFWRRQKAKTHPGIRFIYATKDELFGHKKTQKSPEQTDSEQEDDTAKEEVRRANRTKFFDLIIPVVPFVTHISARDLVTTELGEDEAEKLGDLVNIAARHIPDARLIRNTCNEYRIYQQVLLRKGKDCLDLDPRQLFAMMLYKAVHLDDYEKIRLGDSNLDIFYRKFRELISKAQGDLGKYIAEQNRMLQQAELSAELVKEYGEKLYAALVMSIERESPQGAFHSLSVFGERWEKEDLYKKDLWQHLFEENIDSLTVTYKPSRSSYNQTFDLHRHSLERVMGISFNDPKPLEVRKEEVESKREEARDAIEKLRDIDIADAYSEMPGEKLLPELRGAVPALARDALTSDLATDLFRHGFITRDFTLYTSIFHTNHLSANAANFLLHHLRSGNPDFLYDLSEDEVAQLLAEADSSYWELPGACNCCIIETLLSPGDSLREEASRILEGIKETLLEDEELVMRLSDAYLSGSFTGKDKFILWSTPTNPTVFTQLVDYCDQPKELHGLLDKALSVMSSDIAYQGSDSVAGVIQDNLAGYTALTSAGSIADPRLNLQYLQQLEIPLDDLGILREDLREMALENCYFTLNSTNFSILRDKVNSGSFDDLIDWHEKLGPYLLDRLDTYMVLLSEETIAALDSPSSETFSAIIKATGTPASTLETLLEHSREAEWSLESLDEIDESLWPALVVYGRVRPIERTLFTYINARGIDSSLATFLAGVEKIERSDTEEFTEEDREKLALAILNSDELLSEDARVQLVVSLGLEEYLSLAGLQAKSGSFVASLMKVGIIEDTADVVTFIAPQGPQEVLAAIAGSKEFLDYLRPELLSADVIRALYESDGIASDIKDAIAKDMLQKLGSGISPREVQLVTKYAAARELDFDLELLVWCASHEADPQDIIALLERHLSVIDLSQVETVMEYLGEPYTDLLSAGRHRPRIPGGRGVEPLLKKLQIKGKVSSFAADSRGYRVYMRRR